jgi:nitrogen fixation/metabolism regulation signal transduction histidine kinase
LTEAPRRSSLSSRWLLLAVAQAAVSAAVAAAAAALSAPAWMVVAAGLAAGLAFALGATRTALWSVTRTLQAVGDGVRSFRDGDFSMRLVASRKDELGDLLALYNEIGDALRDERREIYQRELLLDTILQGAPMAIVLTGAGQRVSYANRAARDLLGDGGRLEGRALDEVLRGFPAQVLDALASEQGALFTVGPAGQEETYRALRRSFQLNMLPHHLHLIERLTPELRRREVEVWKKAIRVMNHELNNSLAPIRSLVHSARHILAKPQHAHRLEGVFDTIEDRVTYLADFLEGYARFARLPNPRKQAVPWRPFLQELAQLSPFGLDEPLPERPGCFDPSQMQQVLLNLLKNAHEAGSPPEAVTLSVEALAAGGTRVRVSDRGQGMSDEVMRQALLPFYSSKPSGAGLGLPLCNEILEAHGGRLLLQNRDGGGLVVTCWLPEGPAGAAPLLDPSRRA